MDLASLIKRMDEECDPTCRCDVMYWMPFDFEVPENIDSGRRYPNSVAHIASIRTASHVGRFYYEPFKDYTNVRSIESSNNSARVKRYLEDKQNEYRIANKIV